MRPRRLWLKLKLRSRVKRGEPVRRACFARGPLALFLLLTLAGAAPQFAAGCRRNTEHSLRAAAEAWDGGDYELAAEEYEQYLKRDPAGEQSLEARFQLANIYYYNLHRHDQARAHYREFLEQGAEHAEAHAARERLAEVLTELGRSYEAIAEYETLNPGPVEERRRIRLRIAELYYDQKNYSQALTEYEKVIDSPVYDQLSEQAYLRVAAIHHLVRGQHQLALPAYEKLASQTADPEVRRRAIYGISDCYAGLDRFDEAISVLKGVDDESERAYVAERVADLEKRKREAAGARSGIER
jgi:tetratricopeptide (TPR) repeat protein